MMMVEVLYDEAGRYLATQTVVERPAGPWDQNLADEKPCSWHAAGRARTAELKALGFVVSSSLCNDCAKRLHAELDAIEQVA